MESGKSIQIILADLKARLFSLLEEQLKMIVLFGSRARGDYESGSDIDIAVIVEGLDRALKMRILKEVAEIELEYLQPLSTLILSEDTYKRLLKRERRIALDIQNEGIPI